MPLAYTAGSCDRPQREMIRPRWSAVNVLGHHYEAAGGLSFELRHYRSMSSALVNRHRHRRPPPRQAPQPRTRANNIPAKGVAPD